VSEGEQQSRLRKRPRGSQTNRFRVSDFGFRVPEMSAPALSRQSSQSDMELEERAQMSRAMRSSSLTITACRGSLALHSTRPMRTDSDHGDPSETFEV
jgi:hypothetical protein